MTIQGRGRTAQRSGAPTRMLGLGLALAFLSPLPASAQQAATEIIRGIENNLIWLGLSDTVANGRLNPSERDAIRAFERATGSRADGTLNRAERRLLERQANAERSRAGYELVVDKATGSRIGLPTAYVGEGRPSRFGTRYGGAGDEVVIETYRIPGRASLRNVYERQMARRGREVTYEVFRDNFFVVAGREGGQSFYTRARTNGREVRAFTINYDTRFEDAISRVVVAMSSDFDAFAAEPTAPRRPARDNPAPRSDAPAPGTAARPACPLRLTVARGDTLNRIAQRCGISVAVLRAMNGNIRPRDLRAGQTLIIPPSLSPGGNAPPAAPAQPAGPTATLATPNPVEGSTVSVSFAGFPANSIIEVGFRGRDERVRIERIASTNGRGEATLDLALPRSLRAGDSSQVVALTAGGARSAVTPRFTVGSVNARPARPARKSVVVVGMLTTEGRDCLALRDLDGELYTLAGRRSGDIDYAAGTPVRVEGREATPRQKQRCGQGETVTVDAITRR